MSASSCCLLHENLIIDLDDIDNVPALCQHPDVILHASRALGHWSQPDYCRHSADRSQHPSGGRLSTLRSGMVLVNIFESKCLLRFVLFSNLNKFSRRNVLVYTCVYSPPRMSIPDITNYCLQRNIIKIRLQLTCLNYDFNNIVTTKACLTQCS